uniref:G-patch domain-containing protein n=1 Tax=Tetraselmis sp. GSL018 TaxID=582737 RepID=A0A061S7Z1_9CHLO|eukprot:CAMPEP_0177595518 /NCGR_PEP_ID=MMETSP0419_2-20121207/10411_1 /TAXON_ID=582737 /ORGANISM="Tetraselmis sp., Strain GSL018" /LENGTH=157 /DNA_ID=CAMNT_0019087007 /DNA_START=333 /DNA_END=806 /DNA_ORIENTATION=-
MGGSGGPPFQETPGTIPRSNIGFQLLQKSGWEQGQGLGASEQGPTEPVKAWHQAGRKGIGAPGNTGAEKKRKAPSEEGGRRSADTAPGSAQPPAASRADKQRAKRTREALAREQSLRSASLERQMRRMFAEEDSSVQHNPLLHSNSRLSASNPLLDD